MAISKTQQTGAAGALIVVGLLLANMAYNDYSGFSPISGLDENGVYTVGNTFNIGESVRFYLMPSLTSEDAGIEYFVWDFHDQSNVYVSTREDTSFTHVFNSPGYYLVTVLALRGSASKVFTVPITITPSTYSIEIQASSQVVEESEIITLEAIEPSSPTPIVNFLWDLGNGETEIGKKISVSYENPGLYKVRIRGYTNTSTVHSGYIDITVENKTPVPTILLSSNAMIEDDNVSLSASVNDTLNDVDEIRFIWEFGDGLLDIGTNVSHIYPLDGTYEVKLHAIDNNGAIGTASTTLDISNRIPSITSLVNERDFYSQGETITTYASIIDSLSDMGLLSYLWSIPGDGQQNSYPFFDVGSYTLDFTVTDDDSASASASTDTFQVINVNPYVSLLNATSAYDVTFRTWGTQNTDVNITFFQEGNLSYNLTMNNQNVLRNESDIGGQINNLIQPLNQYWEIQIDSINNVSYDTFVETTFSFDGYPSVSLVNHCSDQNTDCLSSSYRFPIAPIDRGFPVTYDLSVFDPGNDDLTITMDMAGNLFTLNLLSPISGPTNGTVSVTAILPNGVLPSEIEYYVTDEHGGSSELHAIPFVDYGTQQSPIEFQNQSSWFYFGNHIKQVAPNAEWNMPNTFLIGDEKTFMLEPVKEVNQTLNYIWHFGDGTQSSSKSPIHSYSNPGTYLVWVVIQNQYYSHVEHQLISVESTIEPSTPAIIGMKGEGMELEFVAAGLSNESDYNIHWDFGDGTTGFGYSFKHQYSQSGNYTAILTISDRYNQVDFVEFPVIILNQDPWNVFNLQTFYEVAEGNNIFISPTIEDSPYDLLNLQYTWDLDGSVTSDPYVSILSNDPASGGTLTVSDPEGSTFTHDFGYNVTSNPIEVTVLQRYSLYGSTDMQYNITGMLSPSVISVDDYKSTTQVEYTMFDKFGTMLDNSIAEYFDDSYGFRVAIDTSSIANEEKINSLKNVLSTPEDLTSDISLSGTYDVVFSIRDTQSNVPLNSVMTKIDVIVDSDGDLISDELEILYSNTVDFLEIDPFETDTDDDGIADPVEYVLGEDADGDGLTSFYEEIYGTSDENSDTDGDGLTDGYGIYGEFTHGTDPLVADTDGDGLKDGEEIAGWQVQKVTPRGLEVISVSSDPNDPDKDQDGINDFMERNLGSNPNSLDTDDDGLNDTREQQVGISLNSYDSDGDYLSDYLEVMSEFVSQYYDVNGTIMYETYYLNPGNPDTDNDQLSDYEELYWYNSRGSSKDTDSDGIEDYQELFTYYTRVDKADTDGDLLSDGIELAGFDIPVTLISGGVYAEDLSVITAPTVSNYTLHVVTNPLLSDTDGDGLTDGDELFGDTSNVSDPTNIDSDGDGILDQFDTQRLVSDWEPAKLASNIYITYSIQPSTAVRVASTYVYNTLANIWSLTGSVISDVLDYAWYWGSSCWWGICVYYPVIRSWWDVANYAIGKMLNYVRNNPSTAFPTSGWAWLFTYTVNFFDFSMTIHKNSAGFPNGISFGGYASMLVQNPYSVITGIVNPTINFLFDVSDNQGISNIKIYRNNGLIKHITNINRSFYTVNEFFSVIPSGFSVPSSTFRFEIYDLQGNVRIVERTTSVAQFTAGLLQQGTRYLQDVLQPFADAWNWVTDGFNQLGSQVVNAVNHAVKVVEDTVKIIGDWIKQQFDNVWENFVRNTLSDLTRQYLDKGKAGLESLDSSYLSIKDVIPNYISSIVDGSILSTIQTTVTDFSSNLANVIPAPDMSAATSTLNGATDAFLALFDGSVIGDALSSLGQLANDILNEVINDMFRDVIANTFGKYEAMMMNSLVDVFTLISSSFTDPNISLGSVSMDQSSITDQISGLLNSISSPMNSFSQFLTSIDSNTFLSIIDFVFVDNPNLGTSFNDILHAMYSPLMAIGFAIDDLFSLIPSGNMLLQLNDMSIKPNQADETLTKTISIAKLVFKAGGAIYKELFGIDSDAKDRKFDSDVEITDKLGSFFSPQFFGAIGLFINGAIPAVLSTLALELTSIDAATAINLQRLQIVGFIKAGIAMFQMAVLGGLVLSGARAHSYADPEAIFLELGIFILTLSANIYDVVLYTDIVANTPAGFDQFAKAFELSLLYLGMVKDVIVLFTNNGQLLPPNAQPGWDFFGITFLTLKLIANLALMMAEFDKINQSSF